MGRPWRLLLAAALVAATAACTTTQPLSVSQESAEVQIQAVALVKIYDTWDYFYPDVNGQPRDVNGDGSPDVFLQCQDIRATNSVDPDTTNVLVPIHYAVEVDRIRSGSSTVEALTDPNYMDLAQSLTPYDDTAVIGKTPTAPLAPIAGVLYANPRRLTGANRRVLESPSCPYGLLLGPANLAGVPPPFTTPLGKGDTIVVKARKSNETALPFLSAPTMSGTVLLGGRVVALTGTTSSTTAPGSGFSFSFTSR